MTDANTARPIVAGGTGATSAAAALVNLLGTPTSGKGIVGNGTAWVQSTVVTSSDNLSVFAATTSAQLRGVISDETGTGALVFGTSPTLDSPVITGNTGFGVTPLDKVHVLGNLRIESTGLPKIVFNNSDNGADLKKYQCYVDGTGRFLLETLNDAENAVATRLFIGADGTIYAAGGGTVATTTGAVVARNTAKAWANFTGANPHVLNSSYNVSSVTHTGTGAGTVNVTTALAANAAPVFSFQMPSGYALGGISAISTGSVSYTCALYVGGALSTSNATIVSFVAFGE